MQNEITRNTTVAGKKPFMKGELEMSEIMIRYDSIAKNTSKNTSRAHQMRNIKRKIKKAFRVFLLVHIDMCFGGSLLDVFLKWGSLPLSADFV